MNFKTQECLLLSGRLKRLCKQTKLDMFARMDAKELDQMIELASKQSKNFMDKMNRKIDIECSTEEMLHIDKEQKKLYDYFQNKQEININQTFNDNDNNNNIYDHLIANKHLNPTKKLMHYDYPQGDGWLEPNKSSNDTKYNLLEFLPSSLLISILHYLYAHELTMFVFRVSKYICMVTDHVLYDMTYQAIWLDLNIKEISKSVNQTHKLNKAQQNHCVKSVFVCNNSTTRIECALIISNLTKLLNVEYIEMRDTSLTQAISILNVIPSLHIRDIALSHFTSNQPRGLIEEQLNNRFENYSIQLTGGADKVIDLHCNSWANKITSLHIQMTDMSTWHDLHPLFTTKINEFQALKHLCLSYDATNIPNSVLNIDEKQSYELEMLELDTISLGSDQFCTEINEYVMMCLKWMDCCQSLALTIHRQLHCYLIETHVRVVLHQFRSLQWLVCKYLYNNFVKHGIDDKTIDIMIIGMEDILYDKNFVICNANYFDICGSVAIAEDEDTLLMRFTTFKCSNLSTMHCRIGIRECWYCSIPSPVCPRSKGRCWIHG